MGQRMPITIIKMFGVAMTVVCTLCMNAQAAEPAAASTYARDLLTKAGRGDVEFQAVQNLGHDEAFRVTKKARKLVIEHQKPAGGLYGAQAVIAQEYKLGKIDKPDLPIRGTTLPMFHGGGYKSTLSAKTFPWFFDKQLMTRTLDAFADARFNTIFLWGSHTFPYIDASLTSRDSCGYKNRRR